MAGNGLCCWAVIPIASELPGTGSPESISVRNGMIVPMRSEPR